MNPCATHHFEDVIPDRTKLYYTIRAMRERRELRFVAYHQPPRGRPLDVWCNGWWPDKLAHDLGLTDLLLPAFADVRHERGPFVDPKLRPDATLYFPNREIWHWEYDTGHQTFAQVKARWENYLPLAAAWTQYHGLPEQEREKKLPPAYLLVVTCRKSIERLVELAAPYEAFIHFAYRDDLLKDPYGEVVFDVTLDGGKPTACAADDRIPLPPCGTNGA